MLSLLKKSRLAGKAFDCFGQDGEYWTNRFKEIMEVDVGSISRGECRTLDAIYRDLNVITSITRNYETIATLKMQNIPKADLKELRSLSTSDKSNMFSDLALITKSPAHCYYALFRSASLMIRSCDSTYFQKRMSKDPVLLFAWLAARMEMCKAHKLGASDSLLQATLTAMLSLTPDQAGVIMAFGDFFEPVTKYVLLSIGNRVSQALGHYGTNDDCDSVSAFFSIVPQADVHRLLNLMRIWDLCVTGGSVCAGDCLQIMKRKVCSPLEEIINVNCVREVE
jgi:hypothetical protein